MRNLLKPDLDPEAQSYSPNNAQPSVGVPVPTTSTSLPNKGKSPQASSLSEESPLNDGPHSKNSLDTTTSSELGTSDSSNCLPNELPSCSLPHLNSEGDINDAISVNLEDDTDSVDNSESDSDSNNLAPEPLEEAGVIYDLFRQMPEEQCPWASTASLLDKLRAQGLI
jgi:hypothetical protein